MPSIVTAYQLGCKYAADLLEKEALGPVAEFVARQAAAASKAVPEAVKAAPGFLSGLASRPVAQYAAGGLGGAGLGALAGGEDNRLRGAMMGAGLGLGGVAGARMGHKFMSGKTPEEMGKILQRGNPESLYNVDRAAFLERHPMLAQKRTQGLMGLAGGGAAGAGLGIGAGTAFAPEHQEKSWTQKLRGMLPF